MPRGAHRALPVAGEVGPPHCIPENKSGCPNATVAGIPLENGGLNSRTRLSFISATHRLPLVSKAMPRGSHKVLSPTDAGRPQGPPEVRSGRPIASAAAIPFVNGGTYSSTRP